MPNHQKPTLNLPLRLLLVTPLIALLARAQDASTTPPPGSTAGTTAPSSDASTAGEGDSSIVLNPFTVDATKEKGYFAPNTLAGTRLNTNVGDLPSSISVVTKQQLEDTNSRNINDVFRYETNTEGAHTYTPYVLVRGQVSDTLAGGGGTSGGFTGALATGNRIRGLAAADNEEDNFFSLYRIPFDSYNTQSIEIDRGPNSLIFGTGSPAGIVNQSRTTATLNKFSAETNLQVSSFGGYRESIGINIPLLKDRLAIYVAQLYNSEGFKQKPSADITRRQYAAFTFTPFKNHKTKLTGSFENYNNYANDPNSITPLDFVSPWMSSGRPVYNPVTGVVTYLSTGVSTQPYALSTTSPNYVAGGPLQANLTVATSPFFVPSLGYIAAGHNVMFINQGNVENFYRAQQSAFTVPGFIPSPLTPAQALVNAERLTQSLNLPVPNATAFGLSTQYATWQQPGLTNKGIYDWSTINLNSIDNTYTRARTYTLDLQQEIGWGLNLDIGWFRQELKQTQDSPLSQANATTIYVDTNSYLLNGDKNPHVGEPTLDVYSADVYEEPEINNNFRIMLEYEVDFRNKDWKFLHWLGHHRVVAAFTQHDDVQTNLRYRPAIYAGDANYLPTAATLAQPAGYAYPVSNAAIEQIFYLGGGKNAPGYFNRPGYGGPTSAQVTTYNYAAGQWQNSTLNMTSLLFNSGGISENLQDQKAYYWQSYLWNDRLVGTLGISDDQVKNRNTIFPTVNPVATLYTNGFPNKQYWFNEGPWSYVGGNTSSEGFVLHPFKNWDGIDRSANHGNIFAGFLRTLGFSFNKADNFNPPAGAFTDFFGNPLGKPQGQEKDYGIQIATPDNKFFLRATWFTNSNLNQVTTFTSNGRANNIDATELKAWATAVVEVRNGLSPSDPTFNNFTINPVTLAEQSQIAAITGLPYNYGGNVGATGQYVNPTGTEDGQAKGIDLELTYNPLPNWTMKVTWGKQQTTIKNAAAQAAAWLAYRNPAWLKYVASDLTAVYTKSDGTPLYLGNFWQGYGYDTNVTANSVNGWTTTQNYYNIVVASALATDQANNGGLAPNQREYSWNYLTNYTIDRGPLKDLGFGGDFSYSGRATAGYYGDPTKLNSTGQITAPNINNPIYTPSQTHIDLWLSYRFALPGTGGKVKAKVQFNVTDITSKGYLLPVSYNFDGSPAAERIIPPRQFTLSTKFDF